jgi:hypothetical protein
VKTDDLQLDLMERQVIGRPVMPHMRAGLAGEAKNDTDRLA